MRDLFFFLIGSGSIVLVFITYVKWLVLYARIKKSTISKLYSKGIALPFKITESEKEINEGDKMKLNKTRKLLFTFLIIAFLIAIMFNILHDVN
jgi:hypothetical protein